MKKRVLIIAANLCIGGAEKVARDLGMLADSNLYEFHYIVFGNAVGDYEHELIERGCKVFHLPAPRENYFLHYRQLKVLMKKYSYSVVHSHTMFNIGWAMLAAKRCGVPVRIAHAHSALNDGASVMKYFYEKAMRHVILQDSTDLVACGNAAGIRLFGEKAYEKRGYCILNGIDTGTFRYNADQRDEIREKYGLNQAFVVGHVGHLAKVKNQSFLIQLMPRILKRRPNAKLLLLGEGEDRPILESLIQELHLENHVIMTGNVRNVQDYLSAMDVFAFPSLYEGMPLSILEVQANGLPCILSTGVPDDVNLTDLVQLISLSETDRWIEAICGTYRGQAESYADAMKDKGFDVETVMKKFYKIYERAECV